MTSRAGAAVVEAQAVAMPCGTFGYKRTGRGKARIKNYAQQMSREFGSVEICGSLAIRK